MFFCLACNSVATEHAGSLLNVTNLPQLNIGETAIIVFEVFFEAAA